MPTKNGREIAHDLMDMLNGASKKDREEFIHEVIHGTHRTIQQAFFRGILVPLVIEYAKLKPGQYDLRNEATVRMCKELAPYIEGRALPYV